VAIDNHLTSQHSVFTAMQQPFHPDALLAGLQLDRRWTAASSVPTEVQLQWASPNVALPFERRAAERLRVERLQSLGIADLAPRTSGVSSDVVWPRVPRVLDRAPCFLHGTSLGSASGWHSVELALLELGARWALQHCSTLGNEATVATRSIEADSVTVEACAAASLGGMSREAIATHVGESASESRRGLAVGSIAWQCVLLSMMAAEVRSATKPMEQTSESDEAAWADSGISMLIVGGGAVGMAVARAALLSGVLRPKSITIATPRTDDPNLEGFRSVGCRVTKCPKTLAGASAMANRVPSGGEDDADGVLRESLAKATVIVLATPVTALSTVSAWLGGSESLRRTAIVISTVSGMTEEMHRSEMPHLGGHTMLQAVSRSMDRGQAARLRRVAMEGGTMDEEASLAVVADALGSACAALQAATIRKGGAVRDEAAREATALHAKHRERGVADYESTFLWLKELSLLHRPSPKACKVAWQRLVHRSLPLESVVAVHDLVTACPRITAGLREYCLSLGGTDALWGALSDSKVLGLGGAGRSVEALAAALTAADVFGRVSFSGSQIVPVIAAPTLEARVPTVWKVVSGLAARLDDEPPDSRLSIGVRATLEVRSEGSMFLSAKAE
jgi:hypothetical protein